jgi:hypothetical protein
MSAEIPPGYNTPIPPKITTPDQVKTSLGTLEFSDGVPSLDTSQKLFRNLDLMRGVEVFLNCIGPASMEALRLGHLELGVDANHKLAIMDQLLDSDPLFLTGNTDTVYCSGFVDLSDGPLVVEIPPGCGPGTVNTSSRGRLATATGSSCEASSSTASRMRPLRCSKKVCASTRQARFKRRRRWNSPGHRNDSSIPFMPTTRSSSTRSLRSSPANPST